MVVRSLLFACGLLGVAACCEETETELVAVKVPVYPCVAEREVRTATIPVTADPCDMPAPDIASCSPVGTVRASDLVTQPDCYIDRTFRGGEAGRVMACPGGRSLVVFEKAVFSGDFANGYIHACKTTSYDLPRSMHGADDCTWRTEQRVSGSLSSGFLSFSYAESPVAGESCTLACTAKARLDLL